MEVEVTGTVEEISAVFDGVLSSVARHFPGLDAGFTAPTEGEQESSKKAQRVAHSSTVKEEGK
jgi:hypothetical protein